MQNQSKQVIVMRNDLGMRKGKMIAQGAHASIAFLTRKFRYVDMQDTGFADLWETKQNLTLNGPERDWIFGRFTKICVRVDSEQELIDITKKAKDAGLTVSLIQDAGLTEFKDENGDPLPTYTCCAIGPNWEDQIDAVTGHLKLL